MTAQFPSYTQLSHRAITAMDGDWTKIPMLEDRPRGDRLVQSFSEGRLRRSLPLICSQAAKGSYDEQFLGAALLGELLPSDVVS